MSRISRIYRTLVTSRAFMLYLCMEFWQPWQQWSTEYDYTNTTRPRSISSASTMAISGWKYAFTLSKEEVRKATPPGTVRLIAQLTGDSQGEKDGEIIRVPVPSSDPADPLNWAPWRKISCQLVMCLYSFVANFATASIAPALPLWNQAFPENPKSFTELTHLQSYHILLIGLGNIVMVPLANVFGRRPILLLSTLILFVATLCGGFTSDFDRLLAIRIIQAVGCSASETVVPAMVESIFFVHERGRHMGIYTAFFAGGSIIGGITGGYIVDRLGWFWVFWLGALFSGTTFLCTLLLVPESVYDREVPSPAPSPRRSGLFQPPRATPNPSTAPFLPSARHLTVPSRIAIRAPGPDITQQTWYRTASTPDIRSPTQSVPPPDSDSRPSITADSAVPKSATTTREVEVELGLPSAGARPYTYLRSLSCGIFRGRILLQFLAPWLTLRLPGTWVVMLQYSAMVAGVGVVATIGPAILAGPPYLWGANAGLIFVGGLVGIILGGTLTAVQGDAATKRRARRAESGGYAEPEARLPLVVPGLVVATAGLLVFGFCAKYPGGYNWVGMQFAFGMISFGLTQVPSVGFTYIVDAYAHLAGDCFVMINILRSIIPFAWTFFVSEWIQSQGALIPFGIFTMIMGVFSLLIIPLIMSGKRMRIATARYVAESA